MANHQLSFREIVNIDELKKLFEAFSTATGFTTGLVDKTANEILIGTGWRDICVKFHRANSASAEHCKASGRELTAGLNTPEEIRICHCQSGLVDGCTPIFIEGSHIANLFTGQVLFAPPDIDRFKEQARQYGYDEQAYLEALSEVPVVNEESFKTMLLFLARLATMVAKIGLANLQSQRDHREIANNKALLDSMINSIPDLIFYKDSGSVYLGCNQAFGEFVGRQEKDIVGHTDFDFFPKEVADFFRGKDLDMMASGFAKHNEESVLYPDGREVILDTLKTPYIDSDSNILGLIGVSRDITERKKIETELLKVRKLESVGVLAGGIAHDFNNILTAIIGNISLAMTITDPKDEIYELLLESEKASLRAKDLTQQLLTFSKGGEPVKKIAVIDEIIKDSAGFVLRGSNVRCVFKFGVELWPVAIDMGQISQVIQNIVVNASQAMPNGGTVTVDCLNYCLESNDLVPVRSGNYIKIIIKDQGIGIPTDMLDNIFDPYFTTKQVGSGLGLAITHSIISKHDGCITVDSKPGQGTTFTIYLPASEGRPELGQEAVVVSPANARGRIMIMDDEEMVRALVERALSRSGYEVMLAPDGNEAIRLYQKAKETGAPIDLIIMDLTIPGGIGGKEAIKEIHKIDPQAKVIVSSGYSNDPVMADFGKYGFCAALVKPFKILELLETVGKAVSR